MIRLLILSLLMPSAFLTLSACSTTKEFRFKQILSQPLRVRRPVYAAADAAVGPGGYDYQSNPLPKSNFDCQKAEELYPPEQLSGILECLTSLAEKQVVKYELKRGPNPTLELVDVKANPECIKESLAEVPVPREIFYQVKDKPDQLSCFSSSIDTDKDRLLGSQLPKGHFTMNVKVPLDEEPTTIEELKRMLVAWSLTPFFWEEGDEEVLKGKYVPVSICRTCFESEKVLEKRFDPTPMWPSPLDSY